MYLIYSILIFLAIVFTVWQWGHMTACNKADLHSAVIKHLIVWFFLIIIVFLIVTGFFHETCIYAIPI